MASIASLFIETFSAWAFALIIFINSSFVGSKSLIISALLDFSNA